MGRARPDQNNNFSLIAVSSADGFTPIELWADPTTHAVLMSGSAGGSSGASATGGYTPGKVISAASTNATNIKASAGTLGYLTASNINASPRYLKVYDNSGTPTVGTDVPIHTFLIPGNTSGAGSNIPIPTAGVSCLLGIAIAITTGALDTDATGVAASEIIINYGTK